MEKAKLLLTVTEAGALLSLGRSKTYELVRDGLIPTVRIDGCRRVRLQDLHEYVERLAEAS